MHKSRTICGAARVAVLVLGCSGSDPSETGGGPGNPGAGGTLGTVDGAAGSAAEPGGDPTTAPGADPGAAGAGSGTPEGTPEGSPLDAPLSGNAGSEGPAQESLAPLPSVRQEHAVVALGTDVYVIGGFTPNATSSVEAFDTVNGTWRSVAEFPNVLHHANAASIGGKLLVAGFYLGSSFTDARGNVYEYDPALDTWVEKAPLPAGTERASSCVATLDGKLYLFGGARAGSVADASVYDPASDTWQPLPALPEPREHCAAGAIDGTIIIAGGRAAGIGGFQPNTWAFDPEAQTYQIRAPLLTARGGVAGAVIDGKLVLFGGEGNASDPTGVFSEVEAYDPATDTWQALPDMLFPRHGLGAAALGESIFLPGGASQQGFGAEDTHTVFSL